MTKRQRLKRDPMNRRRSKVWGWAKKYGAQLERSRSRHFGPSVISYGPKAFHPDTHGRRRRRTWKGSIEDKALHQHGFALGHCRSGS